jgi:hypothetical protein
MTARCLVGALAALLSFVPSLAAQQAFGMPTPDAATSLAPRIELPPGPLLQGQTFGLTLRGTRPTGQSGWLLVSTQPSVPQLLGGVTLHVATGGGAAFAVLPVQLPAASSGPANLTFQLQLPAFRYFIQLLTDTGGSFAASCGQSIPVFSSAPNTNPHNTSAALGTNLSGLADWSSQLPLVDVFRTSREWISGDASTWSNNWPIDMDALGNVRTLLPGQIVRTVMFSDLDNPHPGGRYLLLHQGVGTIQWGGAVSPQPALSTPGRLVVDVNGAGSTVILSITALDGQNPLRDFHFVPEAAETTFATDVFTPQFLQRTRSFALLRFMDWQQTNNSPLATWAQRPRLDEIRWSTGRGLPVEIMVELANRLDADAWFCMPHLADDAFVTAFATYVRDNLEPGRKCYIEHSNEVWNGIFGQASHAQQRGLQLGLSTNPYEAQLRYHSQRSVQIFNLFSSVFGGTSRLVRVLASQHANPWGGDQILSYQNAYLSADALATAPYFGPIVEPATVSQFVGMTVNQILDYAQNVELPATLAFMQQNTQTAQGRGLVHIAYEGGQHLVGVLGMENNQTLTNLLIGANRHPRMATIYQQYLAGWRTAGGRMFAHFSDIGQPSKWGSWGALEFRDQEVGTAPKFATLQSFLLTNPRWW